jgi:ATPase subunit of ABC transporter with duplicated ATPase domains
MKRPSGRHALEFKDVTKGYDGQPVIKGFSAAIQRGQKIALMGRNGMGKTTMLKALLASAPGVDDKDVGLDSGVVTWGHEAQVGYFAQDHRETIRNGTTVSEWLHNFDPQASKEEIHGLLGQMLFRGEEGSKPTDALSGGEAARLIFCKLMLQKPNVLVFDEPTNHLDLEAINALNQALQKYEGTVLLVTHDEDLVDEVATRIWHFSSDGIEDFTGPYAEYMSAATAR